MFSAELIADLIALGSVIVVDLALAGDNAIVVGMAAYGLPPEQRKKAILFGIAVAMLCRIAFALVAVQLLAIIGLLLAGGLLLLWVAWKMWRELRESAPQFAVAEGPGEGGSQALAQHGGTEGGSDAGTGQKTFGAAILQIVIADVSMSLDNVLAVAGTARHNMYILAFGLFLSVLLMGVAAGVVARYLARYRWLSYLGLIIVTFVALSMIYEGTGQVLAAIAEEI